MIQLYCVFEFFCALFIFKLYLLVHFDNGHIFAVLRTAATYASAFFFSPRRLRLAAIHFICINQFLNQFHMPKLHCSTQGFDLQFRGLIKSYDHLGLSRICDNCDLMAYIYINTYKWQNANIFHDCEYIFILIKNKTLQQMFTLYVSSSSVYT